MAGNVLEWTSSQDVNGNSEQFLLKGGSWDYPLTDATLSSSFPYNPWRTNYMVGFRVLIEAKSKEKQQKKTKTEK